MTDTVWEDVWMRRTIAYILLALPLLFAGVVAGARAQSSQPYQPSSALARPTDSWAQGALALADALVRADDSDALGTALPAGTVIRCFDTDVPQDRLSLRAATAGGVVVSVLSYTGAPDTVASDLSLDIRRATFLPEELRSEFAMEGEAAIERANETASHWVTSALQPGVQQPVALIALWKERAGQGSQQPQQQHERGTMVFILLKGRQLVGGDYAMSYLVYGDVHQIVR